MIMISVGQLTRRGSASFGSSIEAASAARCRTSGSSSRRPRRLRPSSGSSAGFCSCLSAPSSISGSRHRAAASAARSAPIDHRGGRDGAGQVAIELIRRRAHRGVAEVRQDNGLPRRVDQHRVTADRAVSDAGPPQGQQLAVQVIERGVADLGGVGVRQRRPGRHPVDQQRVPGRSRRSRLDDLGHGDIRQARSHGDVGLVLDLLKPGDRQARPGVPVQQEPARLGEQPGIGRVPAVDRDTEATGRIRPAQLGRLEPRHPPDLPGHRVHIARRGCRTPRAAAGRPRPRAGRAASRKRAGPPPSPPSR